MNGLKIYQQLPKSHEKDKLVLEWLKVSIPIIVNFLFGDMIDFSTMLPLLPDLLKAKAC